MANKKQITFENFSYLIIFGLALLVRLLMLGKAPLGEFEATWAYQAWELAQGQTSHVGLQASYLTLTEGLFSLFTSSNALARFWPAVIGSFIVCFPFFFRAKLGQKAALVMALGLALDPGLVAVSRLAGGPILALVFSLLAMGFYYLKKPVWAMIFGGLALFAGPALWMGALGLALTFGVSHLAGAFEWSTHIRAWFSTSPSGSAGKRSFPWGFALALGVVTMQGTLFLQHYQGLSAWLDALPAYAAGWVHPSGVHAVRLLAALLVYQPLALIFGLIAAGRAWVTGEKTARFLSIWFVSALALGLLYPGRQVYDLIWALVPLWALAAMELIRGLETVKSFLVTRIHAASIFVLFALTWLSFVTLVTTGAGDDKWWLRWVVMGAALLLIGLATSIVHAGWSWPVAKKGLVVGVCAAFGTYLLAAMVGAAYLRPANPQELWHPGSGGVQMELLQESLGEFGLLTTGRQDNLDFIIIGDSEVLRWGLRQYPNSHFREAMPAQTRPAFVLSPLTEIAQPWTTSYNGQDFVLETSSAWAGNIDFNWMKWLAFRDAPLDQEKVVLWVRHDAFPGVETSDTPPASSEEGVIEE